MAEIDSLLVELENEEAAKQHEHIPKDDPTTGKYGCFGKQSTFTTQPKACGPCKFGSTECTREGHRLLKIESEAHKAAVIAFPTPSRPIPAPVVESPAEGDSESATTTAAPAPRGLLDTLNSQQYRGALAAMQGKDDAGVLATLAATSSAIRPAEGKISYTSDLQCAFLAASFELNKRGVIPLLRPAVRGHFGKSVAANADEITLSNHLRLVDLDYLANHHRTGRGEIFGNLLNEDGTLNFTKALEWVSKNGSAEQKDKWLLLTPRERAELFIIRDEKTRLRWKDLRGYKYRDMQTIKTAIEKAAFHKRKNEPVGYLWELYCMGVLHGWVPCAIIASAARLPACSHLDSPATDKKIRNNIAWLKKCFNVSETDSADL